MFIGKAALSGGFGAEVGAEGPLPSPESGKGFYAGCGCPMVGVLVALVAIGAVSYVVGDLLVNEWRRGATEGDARGRNGVTENPVMEEDEAE